MTPTNAAPAPRRRVAVVGAGYFSQFHLEGWAGLARTPRSSGCAMPTPAKAAALAQRFGIARTFTRVEEMLDALDARSGRHRHAAGQPCAGCWAPCSSAAIPAICQKPFGAGYAEAACIRRPCGEGGVPLVVHENFRFMPWFREARRLIDCRLARRACTASAFRLRPGDGQGPRRLSRPSAVFPDDAAAAHRGNGGAFHRHVPLPHGRGRKPCIALLRRLNPGDRGRGRRTDHLRVRRRRGGPVRRQPAERSCRQNPRRTMGEMWLEGAAGVLRLDGEARLWWKPHHGAKPNTCYDRGPESGSAAALRRAAAPCRLASLAQGTPPRTPPAQYLQQPARAGSRLRLARQRAAHRDRAVRPAARALRHRIFDITPPKEPA